ncbi:hypothetical protein EC835_11432 [Providencia alcalifaciens]|uniref:Uncharacterized protein n=1 Tax=Providencia alcalifaciens TaxID=126385 RepID=A0A4R3NF55_9GAMM|nr:hypothetical protein [Providencia alcalifaciens]MBC5792320.1 hypothetical protein [Providencia sp. JUb39]TCT28901.1 hypothetical protein EC835_11432 [Providencia alcalifaciens]
MGFFDSKSKISRHFDKRVFIGSAINNVKKIHNIGLVSASLTVSAGKFSNEDENLKNELIDISIENGGNAVINFRVETGPIQIVGSSWISSYIIAYGDAVFIEYND